MTKARNLKDYFNCDPDPLSPIMYGGKHMGFFAVVDDIQDGRDFAAAIPGEQRAGIAVFTQDPLPKFTVFLYPEHTLVPKQQQQFIKYLVDRHPEIEQCIVITTSAVILTDAVTLETLNRRSTLPPSPSDKER